MPKITCYIAELNVAPDMPLENDLQVGGRSIPDYFQKASMLESDTPAIDLTIDSSRRHSLPRQAGLVDDGKLQDSLAQLLHPANSDGRPAVGLILVDDLYEPVPNAYGVMFDLDSHEPAFGPRQGCAVFLQKIRAVIDTAGKGDQDFRSLIAYTAIHELGHIFNLWHIDSPASFMKPPENNDFLNACDFVNDEKVYLRYAADPEHESYVLPGGSPFNDRGTIGPSGGDQPFFVPAAPEALKLDIRLSHQEFWHFEPVELDVLLTVANPTSGPVTIPDEIDPGHSCFEIWIIRPDGERHRYRPSKRICSVPKTRQLSHAEPFRRDISIFRQTGGYTFPMAGKYEIQAVLRLSTDKSVSSNIVKFEVLRARPESEIYMSMHEAFSPREAIKLLRYRSRLPSRPDYVRLKQFVDSHRSTISAAAVHYSLGRAFIKSSRTEADVSRSDRLRQQGLFHLEEAAKHPQFSSHRLTIVNRLLGEFGSAKDLPKK